MRSGTLLGTTIPQFTYDTPTLPGCDFYRLCAGCTPLALVFLPEFGHPIAREYLTRYLKSLPQLKSARLACVVRTGAEQAAQAVGGLEFPFTLICDGEGTLYGYFNVQRVSSNFLNWSLDAHRIFRAAREAGYRQSRDEVQTLPLTLLVDGSARILFAHYARSLTDLPADCLALEKVARSLAATQPAPTAAAKQSRPLRRAAAPGRRGLAPDETHTLPDWLGEDFDFEHLPGAQEQ